MRKTLGFLALAGLVALAAAHVVPTALTGFSQALQGAKTLKANYSVQTIGGGKEQYSVTLKKPNLLRVETPTQTYVSDGKDLLTFDKGDGTYFKQPVNASLLNEVLSPESLNVWAGFFDAKALSPVTAKSLGTRQSLDAVEATYDPQRSRVVTYFLDASDKVARKAQIDLTAPKGKTTMVVNAKDVQVGGVLSEDEFAFKAPEGSREMTLEEMSSSRWLTDLDEAKTLAAKTGKRIFVDFMATWCGPCKMLDAAVLQTDKFKEIAKKKFVLLRIDVDAQKDIARMYHIDAMPTQMVLDKNGQVIATTVGYGGPDAFYQFLEPNEG